MTEKTLTTSVKFEGRLISLEVQEVELPDGTVANREIVRHPGAVCCVVLTPELDTVLVRQFRKPMDRTLLEIPAGKLDPGEEPAVAAEREIREEVGYQSGKMVHLFDFFTCPGFCDEKIGLYMATDAVLGEQKLDPGEFLELVIVPFSEAKEMVLQGEIADAKTVAGILAVAQRLGL